MKVSQGAQEGQIWPQSLRVPTHSNQLQLKQFISKKQYKHSEPKAMLSMAQTIGVYSHLPFYKTLLLYLSCFLKAYYFIIAFPF